MLVLNRSHLDKFYRLKEALDIQSYAIPDQIVDVLINHEERLIEPERLEALEKELKAQQDIIAALQKKISTRRTKTDV